MTGRRSAGALLLALTCLLAVLAPASTASAEPAADRVPDGVLQLDVQQVSPTVLTPGDDVTVRATLRNTGAREVSGLSARLLAWTPRLRTREDVRGWATDDFRGIDAGNVLLRDAPVTSLPPGGELPLELTAPASGLGLPRSASSWGPRGLTLDVVDARSRQLAKARAFVVWDPRPAGAAQSGDLTTLSVLAPLTAGPPDVASAVLPPDRVAELTADGGRLARVLQVASRPGVAWALDPALLTAATQAGTPDAAAGTPSPSTPTQGATAPGDGTPGTPSAWLSALQDAATSRDVVALPQTDPDLAAIAHAGTPELYTRAVQQGRRTVADLLDAPARTDVAWPATGAADPATARLAAAAGATAIVLSAGAQPPEDPDVGTVTGRSTVTAGDTRLDGLLVDTGLSTTLEDAVEGRAPVLATSRLLAETAVITRSGNAPHLLLALPRDWDPDVAAASGALDALGSAPWVRRAPLRDLVDTEPPDVDREDVRLTEQDRAGELPPAGLRQAASAVDAVQGVTAALTRPERVLEGVERSAVAATAVSWRDDLPAWRQAVDRLLATGRAVAGGVHVLEGSAVNVVSSEADLPVTVANDLGQEVQVVVSLQPRSPRLVPEGTVAVRIPAESTERVALPVKAVANGNTEVVVNVRAPDGAPLGAPVTVPVRVRADWETRGILVAGGLLALVLVVGLVRTIRRGGRRGGGVDPVASEPVEAR
jgi:hypothetical protein